MANLNVDFIKGIIPPMITPIRDDETLDEAALRTHIDWMLDKGINGVLVCGSNSEFYMMEEDEMEKLLHLVIEQVRGRIPVYMGVGNIRTSKCVRIAKMAQKAGAQAVSILQPMFIKPTDEELEKHFRTIAGAIPSTPVLLYNNPGRCGYGMSQALVEKLAHEVDNIVGMKDSTGDLTLAEEFIRRNRDVGFRVVIGKDTVVFPGLCVGAVGAVCSTANYMPELIVDVYRKFIAGDYKGSLEAQFRLNPLRLATDKSTFPVAAKDCLNLRGRTGGKPYLPTLPSPAGQQENLKREMVKAGLLES